MAYSEELAGRIRDHIGPNDGVVEKAMFGGVAFRSQGNMAVGVAGDELMVRVGLEGYDEAVVDPGGPRLRHDWPTHEGMGFGRYANHRR